MKLSARMASLPCPVCDSPTARHDRLSQLSASEDFYRCAACATLWNVPRGKRGPITMNAHVPRQSRHRSWWVAHDERGQVPEEIGVRRRLK